MTVDFSRFHAKKKLDFGSDLVVLMNALYNLVLKQFNTLA